MKNGNINATTIPSNSLITLRIFPGKATCFYSIDSSHMATISAINAPYELINNKIMTNLMMLFA